MTPAVADDAPFLGTDPASVVAPGDLLVQQWFNWSTGQTRASFNAFESQTEFDYGVTDRLQLALTLVYDWSRTRPAGKPADTDSLPGLAAEAVYIVAPADASPVGLALAVDPAFNAQSRGIAVRVLLQKYLWGLEHVLNINFEDDWDKDESGNWMGSSGITFNYGLAYPIDRNWTLAIELGNEFANDALLSDGRLSGLTNTFFLGPTIQYDCDLATITLGIQAQMPWSSGSGAEDGFKIDAERFRFGLRLTRTI